MAQNLNIETVDKTFRLLAGRLDLAETAAIRMVICGGSA
jgi:hypothetical protein